MRAFVTVLTAVMMSMLGCGRQPAEAPASIEIENVVRATASPIASLTRSVAGQLVPVEMLCPPGQSPSSWRPDPDTVAFYQRARLIVANGADFERWVSTAPLPRSRVVWTARSIEDDLLVVRGETHSHGPSGEHAHDVLLGHTWVDPLHAIAQAGAIAEALQAAFPEHATRFDENLEQLKADLLSLHDELVLLSQSEVQILVSGNALGYLAHRYGFMTIDLGEQTTALSAEPGQTPTQSAGNAVVLFVDETLIESARVSLKDEGIRMVFWDTGETERDRSYVEVLSANIGRLQAEIRSFSKP